MRFNLNRVILWMKNGNVRELHFMPNKVNIIRGGGGTGKTVIWAIIDYCLLASKHKIPERIINENVNWYGINFTINDHEFTICRKSINADGIVSDEFYFSASGEIPIIPVKSISEDDLKRYLDVEFDIHDKVVIPYGGKTISQGSKISMRYFLLFNSQNENTITNSDTFFDRQTETRYKEALDRIFDLALGIDSVEDTLIREKITNLETELKRIDKKILAYEKEELLFEKNMQHVLKRAKEYGLIDDISRDFNQEMEQLKQVIYEKKHVTPSTVIDDYYNLEKEQWELVKKIRSLKKFQMEYNNYKEVIALNYHSLKPIEYIHENYNEIIDVPLVLEFVQQLKDQLTSIKETITKKSPVRTDVKSKISSLNRKLAEVRAQMAKHPKNHEFLPSAQEKLILIGEIKTKLEFYEKKWDEGNLSKKRETLEKEINKLNRRLGNRDEKKSAVLRLLENLIQRYLDIAGDALEDYKGYKAAFDHKGKLLRLQKPNTTKVESIVGSSSNHLFLHLALFLGLHELFIRQGVPYIPSFLFLDQPSRPYYDNDEEKINDRLKITTVFSLLNDYITYLNVELQSEFQFIVVEHIPKEIWVANNMSNVYLVEEFVSGNKLIREEDKLLK